MPAALLLYAQNHDTRLCSLFIAVALGTTFAENPKIIRPKVVIVTRFEVGQDAGDTPGEFQKAPRAGIKGQNNPKPTPI